MTTSKKTTKAAKNNIAANVKAAVKKAGKPINTPATVTTTAKATIITGAANAQAEALSAIAAEKAALNAAFLLKMPSARPVFQAKFKPLNLAAHKPQSASDRDNAFLYAIRTVYNTKPFTQKQTGADSGNLARAINLGLIKATGDFNENNEAFYIATKNTTI